MTEQELANSKREITGTEILMAIFSTARMMGIDKTIDLPQFGSKVLLHLYDPNVYEDVKKLAEWVTTEFDEEKNDK